MLKVDFCNEKPSGAPLTYVVIAARYNGKWVLVRHRERDTYEIPGGHIETGEDYLAAAKRELYEETGAKDFTLDFMMHNPVTPCIIGLPLTMKSHCLRHMTFSKKKRKFGESRKNVNGAN